jgi:hypothetical protein
MLRGLLSARRLSECTDKLERRESEEHNDEQSHYELRDASHSDEQER